MRPALGLAATALGAISLLATPVTPAAAAPTSGSWLGLDSGRLGDYLWTVEARQPAGSGAQGAQSPCLQVGTTWELGPFEYRRSKNRACAGPPGHITAAEPPVIATGIQPSTGAPVGMTAVGMIVAPTVSRVVITKRGGSKIAAPLHKLSGAQAHTARLGSFRYAAFAVRGWWCAERIVTQDASGATLWDSGIDPYACQADGPKLPALGDE